MHTLEPLTLADGALVRTATDQDIPAILALIQALADYEREPDAVENTPELLEQALFADDSVAFCHVVEQQDAVVGIALWFRSYSTWTGLTGIWLEDLFVLPEHRGSGYGRALLVSLARVAQLNGYGRLEWTVLDWNEPSIRFYRAMGAQPMSEWTTQRLDAVAIDRVAALQA
ncbi:GNAT family N-acetyltransferase [Pseudoclavibacter soli]|uniref:GNAT family N-acetyltransferase n=1 Tax=Pseudoclavibacter soli TaxID=452623 RepID=UPI00040A30F4|nr:GNAT family N-acetyltransferase [Pseudoclavibacter soli]